MTPCSPLIGWPGAVRQSRLYVFSCIENLAFLPCTASIKHVRQFFFKPVGVFWESTRSRIQSGNRLVPKATIESYEN